MGNAAVVRAELVTADTCRALGFEARGRSPVVALCERLLDLGFHPAAVVEIYDKDALLRSVSLGEAAPHRFDEPASARWHVLRIRDVTAATK